MPDRTELSVNAWNGEYVDSLYRQWTRDPDSVDPKWRQFFLGFELGSRQLLDGEVVAPALPAAASTQTKVETLIYQYRDLGHFAADLDPLDIRRPFPQDLTLESLGLTEAEREQSFDVGTLPLPNPSPLREIVRLLEETYCGSIGAEYMHIQDPAKRRWLQERMEPIRNRPSFTQEQKLHILRDLIEADGFENFLDTRYKGKKRFSLEGGESLIAMLSAIVEAAPELGITEYPMAMAHRGRLNVLVNVLHKTYDQIFTEFEDAWTEDFVEGGGDVKYHRGFSTDHVTESGQSVHISLAANPSHLESVYPVILGRTRAKQRLQNDTERKKVVPIVMHGDASFPAQGVVAECLNMMRLDGYTVGGTLHIVINNQIGFTTNPEDAHSGNYCTDIAKFVDAPIFHVNGDDPEACVFVAKLALEYRQTFKNNVVIDLWCYRKYGHNEGDEPAFTQPLMYERIRKQQPVLKKYSRRLIDEGVIAEEEFERLYEALRQELDTAQSRSKEKPVDPIIDPFRSVWHGLRGKYSSTPLDTSASVEDLQAVVRAIGSVPEGFTPHTKLEKLLKYRRETVEKGLDLDWGTGEMLAYGTLLLDGHPVRLTGQDTERGTFSHRHAVIFDQQTGEGYIALNHIAPEQAHFCVHNSPLTEAGCVGFEYGYSMGDPRMLIVWEAQFGDFANGAQVIIDQFIASAEVKWERYSGLVLLLPHGYEGQGPEHSSARIERFLQLCADNNMQVVYPTTPAQFFHVLRRQLQRNFRKPLIVMTPKSLLRHPKAVSRLQDLTNARFHRVLDDPNVSDPQNVNRMIFCTGKVYYDLMAHRDEGAMRADVALIRIEQLYPFPESRVKKILDRYQHVEDIVWVQEEPRNMGAYSFVHQMLREHLDLDVPYIGRDMRATPAVASEKMHKEEQRKIMIEAIGLPADVPASPPVKRSGRARAKHAPSAPVSKPAA